MLGLLDCDLVDMNAGYVMVIELNFDGTVLQVRQYPRVAFTNGELGSSLEALGLTSKQEVLFLELI